MAEFFYLDKFNNNPSGEQVTTRAHAILVDSMNPKNFIRGYITEESLDYSITNNFENNSSLLGNMMDQFESAKKTVSTYHVVGKKLVDVLDQKYREKRNETIGEFRRGLESANDAYSNTMSLIGDILGIDIEGNWYNNDYDSADAFMYVFKGTSISHPNKMKITLVKDKLDRDILSELTDIIDKLVGDYEVSNATGELFGVQKAPNDYEMDLNALTYHDKGNAEIKGTWTLIIGPDNDNDSPRFPGLVVTDIQITQSNTYALHGDGNKVQPLFIEIELSLKSVIKYTKSTIKNNILKSS